MCRTRLVRLYLSILDAYVIIIALYTYYICSKLSGVDDEDVVIDIDGGEDNYGDFQYFKILFEIQIAFFMIIAHKNTIVANLVQ